MSGASNSDHDDADADADASEAPIASDQIDTSETEHKRLATLSPSAVQKRIDASAKRERLVASLEEDKRQLVAEKKGLVEAVERAWSKVEVAEQKVETAIQNKLKAPKEEKEDYATLVQLAQEALKKAEAHLEYMKKQCDLILPQVQKQLEDMAQQLKQARSPWPWAQGGHVAHVASCASNSGQQCDCGAAAGGSDNAVLAEVKNLSMQLALLRMSQPEVMTLHAINPSSLMYTQNRPHFTSLCAQLGLTDPVEVPDNRKAFKGKKGNLQFNWAESKEDQEKMEEASYEPMQEFINGILPLALSNHRHATSDTELCHKVAQGNQCDDRLLFNQTVWTLRKNFEEHGALLVQIQRIRGCSDLVVLDQHVKPGDHIRRFMVKFAVDVKPPSVLKNSREGCIREAVAQLIGLCVANNRMAPAVILTDAVQTHIVYWLECVSKDPLSYRIFYSTFQSLSCAVDCAVERAWGGSGDFIRFGAGPTPTPSPDISPKESPDTSPGSSPAKAAHDSD